MQHDMAEARDARPQLKSILKGPTPRASDSNAVSGSKQEGSYDRVVDDSPVRRFLDDDEEPEGTSAQIS